MRFIFLQYKVSSAYFINLEEFCVYFLCVMKPEAESQRTTQLKIVRTKGEMLENKETTHGICLNECDRGAIQKVTNHENNGLDYEDQADSYKNTVDLANDLKEAFQQCQHIVTKIHRRKETSKKKQKSDESVEDLKKKIQVLTEENRQLKQLNESEKLTSGQIELTEDQKREAIVAENIRLRMLLKDVTEVNKRWQKYHHDRQEYVQHLLATIREMEKKLSSQSTTPVESEQCILNTHTGLCSSQQRHSDSDLIDRSAELSMLRQSYERAVKENSTVQKDLEESRRSLDTLTHQLELITKQSKEHVELLEMQVKMFKEDFDAECKEKEAAHKKIADLSEEITSLQSLITSKQCCSPSCSGKQTSSSVPSKVQDNLRNKRVLVPHLHSRGCVVINANVLSDGSSTQETAVQPQITGTSDSWETLRNNDSLTDDKNTVHCPECKMVFPTNHHHKFLDHFKECQKHSSF